MYVHCGVWGFIDVIHFKYIPHSRPIQCIWNVFAKYVPWLKCVAIHRELVYPMYCNTFQLHVSTQPTSHYISNAFHTQHFCVRTFCVNISTGHAARPAHGDPICLRLHIFALVCRGVIRHTDKWGSHSKGILRIFVPIHKLRNLVGLVCEWTVCRNQV